MKEVVIYLERVPTMPQH